jgi:chromosome segregation ATPase
MDASVVEFDPWHWREVSRTLVGLAQLLKAHQRCPVEVISLLATLGDAAERVRGLARALDRANVRLDEEETAHREEAAQLRHAVIDLSLERGQVAEDPDGDSQRLVDLDFQIKELEQRLAAVYRLGQAHRAVPEREVAELEAKLEQVRQQQTDLELQLLDRLRASRPEDPPAEIQAVYEELDRQLMTGG